MNELTRETLGCIWRTADKLARAAEEGNAAAVQEQFEFLRQQVARLEVILKYAG